MQTHSIQNFNKIYPCCRKIVGPDSWKKIISACGKKSPDTFWQCLLDMHKTLAFPDYLPTLSHVEWVLFSTQTADTVIPRHIEYIDLNPTLEVLKLNWILTPLFKSLESDKPVLPTKGKEFALIWRDPATDRVKIKGASSDELLAIKLIVESIRPEQAAESGELTTAQIESIMLKVVRSGILIGPASKIRRPDSRIAHRKDIPEKFISASHFTLQWHITNACDLHCKHCYDRTKRSPLTLRQGNKILDNLYSFCKENHVQGHVCLTGGNPFLSPHFVPLYKKAKDLGFSTSILGNPVPREELQKIVSIQQPDYYQVSLEGLPSHNDLIRGPENFSRVIEFLGVLRDLHITSAVMLTLTRDNMDQILPLAELLRGHVDRFTFNRLSPVGEGANLRLPEPEAYVEFLKNYIDEAATNPILGFKDNLINIELQNRGRKPFGGCTGFGCGAAFNFIAILPDGEVYACRKFPSYIGNAFDQSIAEIYNSDAAQKYRNGTTACQECALQAVCSGCFCMTYGVGDDIFTARDPYCFIGSKM